MSPIKGLSEARRMPRVGKVRLGVKATSQRGGLYPKATDYFVVHADDSTPICNNEAFHRVYGDQPKELDIVLPCEDLDKFFPQWYRRYGSGTGLICKGDGETATEVNRDTGEMVDHECLGKKCDWYIAKKCKAVGNLMFMLPKIDGLGCWQMDTGSVHSIIQINSSVEFIRTLAGRISGLLLKLVIMPKAVQAEGKKKTVYVVDIKVPAGVSLDKLLTTPIPGMERIAAPNWTPTEREAAIASIYGPDPNVRKLPAPPRVVNGDTGEILDVDEGTELPEDSEPTTPASALEHFDEGQPPVAQAPEPKPARRQAGPDPKLATDDMTTFWAWANAHGVAKQAADTYLRAENMNARKALAAMQAVYGQKVEAA